MPPIPWDRLFDLLFDLLEDCGDDSASRATIVQSQPVRVFFGVTRCLRQLDYRGANLRAARREVMAEINAASKKEIEAFASGGMDAVLALEVE